MSLNRLIPSHCPILYIIRLAFLVSNLLQYVMYFRGQVVQATDYFSQENGSILSCCHRSLAG